MEEATTKRKVVGCDQMRPRPRRGMLLMRLSRHPDHSKRKHTSKDYKHIACTHAQIYNLINSAVCTSQHCFSPKPQSTGYKKRKRFLTLLRVQRRRRHKQYKGQLFGVCVTVYGVSKTEKGVFCGLYT